MYEGPGTYRHYKGGTYHVLGMSVDHEINLDSRQIIYCKQEVFGSGAEVIWYHRDLDDFNAMVPKIAENGQVFAGFSVPRFEKVIIKSCDHAIQLEGGIATCVKEKGHPHAHSCRMEIDSLGAVHA